MLSELTCRFTLEHVGRYRVVQQQESRRVVRDIASLPAITIRHFIRLEPGIYFSKAPPTGPGEMAQNCTYHRRQRGGWVVISSLSGWCESREMPFGRRTEYGVLRR
jgi:hypothetical protein